MAIGLDGVLDEAFGLLAEGAGSPGSAWRILTLGSVGLDGSPRLRSVVLRAWDATERRLDVHTDARSAKLAEFSARPVAALHGWDASRKIQLRLSGAVSLHRSDPVAESAWSALRAATRATYHLAPGPGTRLDEADDRAERLDEAAARRVFVVVRLRIAELEWLHFAESGHRRAVFAWADGAMRRMWLAP